MRLTRIDAGPILEAEARLDRQTEALPPCEIDRGILILQRRKMIGVKCEEKKIAKDLAIRSCEHEIDRRIALKPKPMPEIGLAHVSHSELKDCVRIGAVGRRRRQMMAQFLVKRRSVARDFRRAHDRWR